MKEDVYMIITILLVGFVCFFIGFAAGSPGDKVRLSQEKWNCEVVMNGTALDCTRKQPVKKAEEL